MLFNVENYNDAAIKWQILFDTLSHFHVIHEYDKLRDRIAITYSCYKKGLIIN